MWGGYIHLSTRRKPLSWEGIAKIEREVNDFHSERMNSPPQTSSLEYWAQASLRHPTVAQAAQKYLCIPASSATLERSFSKEGHIVRARRARLLEEHVKELSFFVMELGLDVLGINFKKMQGNSIIQGGGPRRSSLERHRSLGRIGAQKNDNLQRVNVIISVVNVSDWSLTVTASGRCLGCAVLVGIVVHYTRLYINGGIMGVLSH